MTRRGLVAWLLLAAVLPWPLATEAQSPGKVPRLGYLWLGAPGSETSTIEGLRQGFRELGYVEGQNILIEYRYAEGKPERLPDLAAELLRLPVDVMLSPGTVVTRVVQQATTVVPVVSTTGDPVGSGFVASLARPGGNITGLSLQPGGCELDGKRLQLLKEALPKVSRVASIWNPENSSDMQCLPETRAAAASLGLQRTWFPIRRTEELDRTLGAIVRQRAEALYVAGDPLLVSHRQRIVEFAARHRLPAMYGLRDFVEAGGLIAYSTSIFDLWRRAATYVDRILKGARPAELPVEQPTKFELVVNLETARALGLTIPQSLLLRADDVIR
jgi:putative ABC transport system substrate-binding protein